MNILFHTEHYYPSIGGVETFAENLTTYLHEQGYDLHVVAETPHNGPEPFPFPVYRHPDSATMRRLIREADLVYVNGYRSSVFLYAALLRKKTVVIYHDVTMVCPKGDKMKGTEPCMVDMSLKECVPCLHQAGELKILRRLFRPQIKTLLSFLVSANVCTSRYSMETYPLARKRYINYGIDTQHFVPAEEETREGDGSSVRLLFVGRLVPEKGCQMLLQALKRLRDQGHDVVLSVCGDGPYRPHLEAQVQRLGLDDVVTFHGGQRGEALVRIMQQADISVVPSLWIEQFGMTAVEAMSCGLPVVGALVGGLRWTVTEAGLGFERGDVPALTRHLEYLVRHPEVRREMGRKAREIAVAKYDIRTMNEKHGELIEELVG
ncbi:hypothetical protein AWN76_015655 [Rhodothermaceae bacterium RA]|nr:hypothetical protein AWN76_015655 [Rhodothermaceae bacterium RA]